MSNNLATQADAINQAVERGNFALALSLANSPAYRAEVQAEVDAPRPTKAINTLPADNASRRMGYDWEKSILRRQDRAASTF